MTEKESSRRDILKKVKDAFYASPDADVTNVTPIPRADWNEGSRWNPRDVSFVLTSELEVDGLIGPAETDDEWAEKVASMEKAVAHLDDMGVANDLLSSDVPKKRREAAAALFLSDLFPLED